MEFKAEHRPHKRRRYGTREKPLAINSCEYRDPCSCRANHRLSCNSCGLGDSCSSTKNVENFRETPVSKHCEIKICDYFLNEAECNYFIDKAKTCEEFQLPALQYMGLANYQSAHLDWDWEAAIEKKLRQALSECHHPCDTSQEPPQEYVDVRRLDGPHNRTSGVSCPMTLMTSRSSTWEDVELKTDLVDVMVSRTRPWTENDVDMRPYFLPFLKTSVETDGEQTLHRKTSTREDASLTLGGDRSLEANPNMPRPQRVLQNTATTSLTWDTDHDRGIDHGSCQTSAIPGDDHSRKEQTEDVDSAQKRKSCVPQDSVHPSGSSYSSPDDDVLPSSHHPKPQMCLLGPHHDHNNNQGRCLTLMIYLSDLPPHSRGETFFPCPVRETPSTQSGGLPCLDLIGGRSNGPKCWDTQDTWDIQSIPEMCKSRDAVDCRQPVFNLQSALKEMYDNQQFILQHPDFEEKLPELEMLALAECEVRYHNLRRTAADSPQFSEESKPHQPLVQQNLDQKSAGPCFTGLDKSAEERRDQQLENQDQVAQEHIQAEMNSSQSFVSQKDSAYQAGGLDPVQESLLEESRHVGFGDVGYVGVDVSSSRSSTETASKPKCFTSIPLTYTKSVREPFPGVHVGTKSVPGVLITPKRGRAVIFFHKDKNGCNESALPWHSPCVVKQGEKWLLTLFK